MRSIVLIHDFTIQIATIEGGESTVWFETHHFSDSGQEGSRWYLHL